MTATVSDDVGKAGQGPSAGGVGRISRIIGPVVDVEFPTETMPEQYNLLTTDVTLAMIVRTGITQGTGLGFIFVPLSTLAFATLAPELRTDASSIFGLVRTIGSSLGISIVVTELASNTQREHAVLVEHVNEFNPVFGHSASGLWDIGSTQGLALLESEVARQAIQLAYIDDFQLIIVMALLAIPSALLLRDPVRAGR